MNTQITIALNFRFSLPTLTRRRVYVLVSGLRVKSDLVNFLYMGLFLAFGK